MVAGEEGKEKGKTDIKIVSFQFVFELPVYFLKYQKGYTARFKLTNHVLWQVVQEGCPEVTVRFSVAP